MFGFESWVPKGLDIANFVNRFAISQKPSSLIRQESLKLILFEFLGLEYLDVFLKFDKVCLSEVCHHQRSMLQFTAHSLRSNSITYSIKNHVWNMNEWNIAILHDFWRHASIPSNVYKYDTLWSEDMFDTCLDSNSSVAKYVGKEFLKPYLLWLLRHASFIVLCYVIFSICCLVACNVCLYTNSKVCHSCLWVMCFIWLPSYWELFEKRM